MSTIESSRRTSHRVCEPDHSSPLACWCSEGEWERCFRTSRFGLLLCSACGCYRIDPVPISSDEGAATFYSDYYQRKQTAGSRRQPAPVRSRTSRFWRVVEQESDLERVQQRVADIGCGEGRLCGELADHGWPSVTGLDVSRSRIARAKQRYAGIRFYDRPLDQTDIQADSLDLVVMDNVIEHLPDPVGLLEDIHSRLAHGGRCVVMTPNLDSGNFRLLGPRWTPELAPHAHIFLFTEASLKQILRQAGFEVQAAGYFHPESFSWRQGLAILRSPTLKAASWRVMQQAGSLYACLIRRAPMLYAVVTKR